MGERVFFFFLDGKFIYSSLFGSSSPCFCFLPFLGFEQYLEEAVYDRYLLIRYDDMVFFSFLFFFLHFFIYNFLKIERRNQ